MKQLGFGPLGFQEGEERGKATSAGGRVRRADILWDYTEISQNCYHLEKNSLRLAFWRDEHRMQKLISSNYLVPLWPEKENYKYKTFLSPLNCQIKARAGPYILPLILDKSSRMNKTYSWLGSKDRGRLRSAVYSTVAHFSQMTVCSIYESSVFILLACLILR